MNDKFKSEVTPSGLMDGVPRVPRWAYWVTAVLIAGFLCALVMLLCVCANGQTYYTNAPAARPIQFVFTNGVEALNVTNTTPSAFDANYVLSPTSGEYTNALGNLFILWNHTINGWIVPNGTWVWWIATTGGGTIAITTNNSYQGPWFMYGNGMALGAPTNLVVTGTAFLTLTNSGWYITNQPAAGSNSYSQ